MAGISESFNHIALALIAELISKLMRTNTGLFFPWVSAAFFFPPITAGFFFDKLVSHIFKSVIGTFFLFRCRPHFSFFFLQFNRRLFFLSSNFLFSSYAGVTSLDF